MNGVIATWMVSALLGAVTPEARWHHDYAEALGASRRDDKPLLVVLHQPNDPRHAVRQIGHATDVEQLSLLQNYHLCQVDVTTKTGQRVAAAFGAKQFPRTVITDKFAEKIIYSKTGRFSDGEWTLTLADHRRGSPPPIVLPAPCPT